MNIPGYQIEQELGHGGMSTVYLALQESLHRQVALKVMAPALAADRNFGERFLREARTVAQLSHPNILAVHDIGSTGHSYYLAMEYVPGGDLKQRIRQGALSLEQALPILRQVAAALGYAHEKGFVHRDVKPENILFRENGSVVLTDFGIAKAVGSGSKMTGTGMTIGTAHYMSPEQARGKTVDGRADLYSLGVVLFEMLTGQVPYDAEDTYAVSLMHISEPAPPLPGNLAALQPLLDRLLAKEPAGRFADAGELIVAIEWLQSGQPLERPVQATRVMKQVEPSPKTAKVATGSGLKWALGGGLLALLVIGGLWLAQQKSKPVFRDSGSVAASTSVSVAQSPEQGAVNEPVKVDSMVPVQHQEEGAGPQQIERLLAEAKRDMQSQRLTSPAGNNALERYRKVLVLDSSNSQARDGLAKIVSHYLSLGDEAIGKGKFAKAKDYLNKAASIVPGAAGLAESRQRLATAEQESEQAELERQKQEAAEREARKGPARGRPWTDPTTGMEFVWVPGGCYRMGDTFGDGALRMKPVHEVCVDGFWMGRTEVTQGQWEHIIGTNPSYFEKGANYPVEQVSWNDTQDFIRKLNRQSGKNYRLPAEAEWEYAARSGGKQEMYADGNHIYDVAWYEYNSGKSTHPVARKRPNGLGLYDMSGNVFEWCLDWYGKDYYGSGPRNNPKGPSSGTGRVIRGGSWINDAWSCRSDGRIPYRTDDRQNILGFRLVLPAGQ